MRTNKMPTFEEVAARQHRKEKRARYTTRLGAKEINRRRAKRRALRERTYGALAPNAGESR